MSKKNKVAQYRSMELLDSIFSEIYGEDVWLIEDMDNVRKMYVHCHELLNAPEKPWQDYEKHMKKFDKCLKKYVAHINHLKGDNS
jgi:hypothetical protein